MGNSTEGLEHISKILARVLSEGPAVEERPEPPYDSPIEAIFASHCLKHLHSSVHVAKQVEFVTKHGSFIVDFCASVGERLIAIECDGKDFHEGLRDELRDSILLGEGCCDTIYHFRGCDIVYWPDDCVWLMSILDPGLFSERGLVHLERLHCLEIDGSRELANRESFACQIRKGPDTYPFWAFRRSVKMISDFPHLRYHWKDLYDFACEHPTTSLDTLLRIRMSRWASSNIGEQSWPK